MAPIPRNFLMLMWHAKFLKAAIAYNAAVFLVFLGLYLAMDFSVHFRADKPVTARSKLYFAVMTHTAIGSNDIVPKTDAARMVVALHALLAWMQLLLVFLS